MPKYSTTACGDMATTDYEIFMKLITRLKQNHDFSNKYQLYGLQVSNAGSLYPGSDHTST
jgi:hypothetical protein